MKKIFAIALALVMVLSMASAFASPCTTGFSWVKDPAATKCGKGSVEVVPYVKVNTNCAPYYDFEVSTCAAAVANENVYYAVTLTVDANADDEWWAQADLTMTYKGVTPAYAVVDPVWADLKADIAANDSEGKANKFYYNFATTEWELVDDDFEFGWNNLVSAVVNKPAEAKVCAKLTSELDAFTRGVVGDYWVKVYYFADDMGLMLVVDADDKDKVEGISSSLPTISSPADFAKLAALIPVDNAVGYAFLDGEVAVVGKINDKCSTSFYNNVTSFFGIELGTKMDKELINKNFGWDDKQESCFAWSKAASAIVDAECVVAIPKTGDASVLAWLF